MPTDTPRALTPAEVGPRLADYAVIDVRTPGEYAGGHLPGALNIPLDQLGRALPELREAAGRRELLMVCASGARSENAARSLVRQGTRAATLTGGTQGWAAQGHPVDRPAVCDVPRATWSMERQVRLAAGTIVLLGLLLALVIHPAFQLLSAAIAAGLVFSALTNTCGMAAVLARLPYNRPRGTDLDGTLARLRQAVAE
ncbi:rhodanese-like domain-containing protein [Streptomyces sp. NPDC057638]|uniref:rhodanese-like domain-containing protein n=1 Tax=Streptomyces sp. NPDC057638 TaxID=3346190 RepID=UPI0036AEC236